MIAPPDWLDPQESYLVGISGGRDSIALHHWLVENQFSNLTYCHLNHKLRGAESDGDEAFLRKLLGHQLIVSSTEVLTLARDRKLSLETAAREARHQFFEQCATQTGISTVLLAHHADDQAETILFNLLRGSAALKGMKPCLTLGPLTYLRPLLDVRRRDLDHYLSTHNHPFRDDSSNLEPIAARNRLRNEALPLLNSIMTRDIVPQLVRALKSSNELEEIAHTHLSQVDLLDPQGRIHLPTFRKLPLPLQKRALHQYLQSQEVPNLTSDLIENGIRLAHPEAPSSLNLPGGQRLRRKESRLFISP